MRHRLGRGKSRPEEKKKLISMMEKETLKKDWEKRRLSAGRARDGGEFQRGEKRKKKKKKLVFAKERSCLSQKGLTRGDRETFATGPNLQYENGKKSP